jgi:transposase InsO family protein
MKTKAKRPPRHRYTNTERDRILAIAKEKGVVRAAEQHSCGVRTIYGWLEERRSSVGDGEKPAAASPLIEGEDGAETHQHASRGRRYSKAERARILDWAEREGAPSAARRFACAEWSINRWRKKAAAMSKKRLEPATAQDLSPEQEARHNLVLETWKKQPGLGPTQIKNQLRRAGYKVSVECVRDIMEAAGYIQPRVKRKEAVDSYEAIRPRQLYHLDFLHLYVHKQKQCLLVIEDDFSRFIAGWALLRSEHADGVIDAFDACVNRFGRPEAVMYDRGAAFFSFRGTSRFEVLLAEHGIDNISVDEPQTNGKVEKLNAAIRKELLTQVEFADLADAHLRIGVWVEQYNYRRTHMGLGGLLVPGDRFHGVADVIMKRIEQGNGADPLDLLAPSSRGLELFRVVSVAGQPSVYLMGKKIL